MVDSPELTESYISKDLDSGIYSKPSEGDIEMHEQKENNGSCTLRPCDSIMETHEMDVNKSSIYPSQNKEKCQKITNAMQFGEHQEKNNPSVQFKSNGSANAIQVWDYLQKVVAKTLSCLLLQSKTVYIGEISQYLPKKFITPGCPLYIHPKNSFGMHGYALGFLYFNRNIYL